MIADPNQSKQDPQTQNDNEQDSSQEDMSY